MAHYAFPKHRTGLPLTPNGFKTCLGCEKDKPLGEFYRAEHGVSGRTARCAECIRAKETTNRKARADAEVSDTAHGDWLRAELRAKW